MEDILIPRLKKAGLPEKEAKIYLSLLVLGKGTLIQIARKAEIDHVTAHYYLKKLQDKKLVVKQQEDRQKYYYIYPPRHAFRNYEMVLEQELDEKKLALTEAIDGFEIRYNSLVDKPQVRFVQGPMAKTECRNIEFNTKFDKMYEFVNLDESYKASPPKKGDHRAKFRRMGYKSEAIYMTEKGQILPKKIRNVNNYYIPKSKFDFPGEIFVFGDRITIATNIPTTEAVIIRHQGFADTLRCLFELALEAVHKYQKDTNNKE